MKKMEGALETVLFSGIGPVFKKIDIFCHTVARMPRNGV